jgi:hypothetical protein
VLGLVGALLTAPTGADMGEMIPELASVRMAMTGSDQGAVAFTSAGAISLSPALIFSAPPDLAWQGLQDLHYRSIGSLGGYSTAAAGGLSEAEAFRAFSTSTAAVLGQLAVINSAAGNQLLDKLNDFVDFHGSFAGVEGAFLSAFSSAASAGNTPQVERANQLWKGIGAPREFGGGAMSTAVLDAPTGRLKLPVVSEFDRALGTGVQDLRHGLRELFGSETSQSGHSQAPSGITEVFKVGTGIAAGQFFGAAAGAELGVLVGGSIGGLLGPIGAVAGAVIGGIVAFFSSDSASSPSAQPAPAQGQHPAAHGHHALVHAAPVVTQSGNNYHYDKSSGTFKEGSTPSGHTGTGHSGHPTSTEPGHRPQSIHPEPHKCWRGDDEILDPEFALPYWGDTVAVAPSVVPEGGGLDGLVSYLGAGVLRFESLPSLDVYGAVESAGLLQDLVITNELVRIDPTQSAVVDPGRRLVVGPDEYVVVDPTRRVVPTVVGERSVPEYVRAVLLAKLRATNVPEGTPLIEALKILRR